MLALVRDMCDRQVSCRSLRPATSSRVFSIRGTITSHYTCPCRTYNDMASADVAITTVAVADSLVDALLESEVLLKSDRGSFGPKLPQPVDASYLSNPYTSPQTLHTRLLAIERYCETLEVSLGPK